MNIDGVRGLLGSGEASVNDVDTEGWGVLHVCFQTKLLSISHFPP